MKGIAIAALVVVAGLGVWLLRAETMTVSQAVSPSSVLDVIVIADVRTADDPMGRLTRAHLDLCAAEAIPDSDVLLMRQETGLLQVDPDERGPSDERRAYRFMLQPGADPDDQDQLRGCLEDVRVRHLRLEVEQMDMRPSPEPTPPQTTTTATLERAS